MDMHHLVTMANNIGDFFAAMTDPVEARAGIAGHIRKFWEPRMRSQMQQHLQQGGEGLHPLVREALQQHGLAV